MANSTPTLPIGTDLNRYRTGQSNFRYGPFSSATDRAIPSENTYANIAKGANTAANDGATTSTERTANDLTQSTSNATNGTVNLTDTDSDKSEYSAEGEQSKTHEIGPDFLWLAFTCLNCGRKYDTLKAAVESYRNDNCIPLHGSELMDTNIYVNFPNYSYLCFGCGYETGKFEEALEHLQPSRCPRLIDHVISLDFEAGLKFTCKNGNCKGRFSTLNEALEHWKTENFPNPQSFDEIPAKHMILVDKSTDSFHCRNCYKKFKTINETLSHWKSKNVTRLSLQNFWIDFKDIAMKCARCGEAFEVLESAEDHRKEEESVRPEEHFISLDAANNDMACQECSEKFSRLNDSIEHLKIETLSVNCGDPANECVHKISADFGSKKLKCSACELDLPNLKKALAHSRCPSTQHVISTDLAQSTIQCSGCDSIFQDLNTAADHWKLENWPCTVKTSFKHKVGLGVGQKTKVFECLGCGEQLATLEDVVAHWKKRKMNKVVKNALRMPFYACTGLCF